METLNSFESAHLCMGEVTFDFTFGSHYLKATSKKKKQQKQQNLKKNQKA